MRTITKGQEPPSLKAYRHKPDCSYVNYPDKDVLRQSLFSEQRGLCCYCMKRIHNEPDKMKIEHWQCQSRYPDEQLKYRNLIGVCRGGQGQPTNSQHCDTRKGDLDLKWNPADPTHFIEKRIRYEMDGSIRSNEVDFDKQLDDVLNLNIAFLKKNRQAVWVGITDWWKGEKERLQGPIPRSKIEKERNRLINRNDQLEPFCQVKVWWLDQRLAKMAP